MPNNVIMQFEGKITKMGRRKIINVPAKNKNFTPGDGVTVEKTNEYFPSYEQEKRRQKK